MFDTNQDEINPTFASDKKFPQPPFLQRSVSAPAIAEHVSEAILPPFKFEVEEDASMNLNFQYANNPSRLNPRMPNPSKKTNNLDEGESAFSHMFNDNSKPPNLSLLADNLGDSSSLSSSLMFSDPQNRTHMVDLIQADFPATPSSFYSNRLLNGDNRFEQDVQNSDLKVMSIAEENNAFLNQNSNRATAGQMLSSNATDSPARLTSLVSASMPQLMNTTSAGTSSDEALEQAQKSLQNLYVSNDSANQPASLLSHIQLHAGANVQAAPFFPPNSPVPNNVAAEQVLPFPMSNQATSSVSVNSVLNASSLPHVPTLSDSNASNMLRNVIQTNGSNSSAFLSNGNAQAAAYSMMGSATAANSANANMVGANQMLQSNSASVPQLSMLASQNAQQNSYFMQPALYLNPNAQPVYYRTAPNGQYAPQDYAMYQANLMDGSALQLGAAAMMGDPSQMLTTQAQLNGAYMSFPGMQPNMLTGFWPQGTPDQQQGQLSMFQQAMPNMRLNLAAIPGVDEQSRLLYATNMAYGNMAAAAAAANSMPVNRGMNGAALNGAMPFQMNNVPMQNSSDTTNGTFNEDRTLGNNAVDSNKDRRDSGHRDNSNHHNNRGGNDRDRNRGNNNNRNNFATAATGNSSTNPSRDSLVEEFRSTFGKSRQWTLRDLTGHIVAFCQDQHGSRFIQQRLEVCSESEKQLVFDEILPSAQILMTDVFGNYVLQKLFEYGTKDQCESLAMLLKGQAVQLSMQMYGCRVVQKALEYVNRERLVELVAEFESPQMLIRCVHDSNGNHVIQKCIEVVSKAAKEAETPEMGKYLSSRIQFVINAFQGQVKELSSHPYGCRVVQRILEHCTDSQKAVVLEELRQCCGELVQDCYGNYVIQFVMQHGWDADRAVLIREVQSNLLDFSQHKFASNVVEKCLQYASKKDRDEMIWTIINVTFDLNNPVDSKGHCVLESMVRDPYANYVVQKVIDVSDERQRAAIMRYVKDNINQLRKYTYGKHIIVRLEKITNEKF